MSDEPTRYERCPHGVPRPHECKECLYGSPFDAPPDSDADDVPVLSTLKRHLETSVHYQQVASKTGNPEGYAYVKIPDWEVRQIIEFLEQHLAESWVGCPGNRDRELTELGQLAGENWGHILPKEPTMRWPHKCKECQPSDPASGSEDAARHELGEAARHYSREYSKAPEQSGFRQWSDACERLETAAVEYAKSLSPKNAAP